MLRPNSITCLGSDVSHLPAASCKSKVPYVRTIVFFQLGFGLLDATTFAEATRNWVSFSQQRHTAHLCIAGTARPRHVLKTGWGIRFQP